MLAFGEKDLQFIWNGKIIPTNIETLQFLGFTLSSTTVQLLLSQFINSCAALTNLEFVGINFVDDSFISQIETRVFNNLLGFALMKCEATDSIIKTLINSVTNLCKLMIQFSCVEPEIVNLIVESCKHLKYFRVRIDQEDDFNETIQFNFYKKYNSLKFDAGGGVVDESYICKLLNSFERPIHSMNLGDVTITDTFLLNMVQNCPQIKLFQYQCESVVSFSAVRSLLVNCTELICLDVEMNEWTYDQIISFFSVPNKLCKVQLYDFDEVLTNDTLYEIIRLNPLISDMFVQTNSVNETQMQEYFQRNDIKVKINIFASNKYVWECYVIVAV